MKEFRREQMVDRPEQLMFDILTELKTISKLLGAKKMKVCTYCGQRHEKAVDYAICANKHKKGSVSK